MGLLCDDLPLISSFLCVLSICEDCRCSRHGSQACGVRGVSSLGTFYCDGLRWAVPWLCEVSQRANVVGWVWVSTDLDEA